MHEHPYSASSWKEACVEEVMAMEGVKVVRGDMCAFGMWQDSDKSEEGKELVMKPTGFTTNAEGLSNELNERCDGYHQHVKLLNGRGSRAEVYPDELLCFRILKGLMETMKKDGRIHANGIGVAMAEEESETWDQMEKAWDDVTGEELDSNGGMIARKEEIKEVQKHEVYHKVPIKECWDKTGKAPIKTDRHEQRGQDTP